VLIISANITKHLKIITLALFLWQQQKNNIRRRMARIKSIENSKLNNDFSQELPKQMNGWMNG